MNKSKLMDKYKEEDYFSDDDDHTFEENKQNEDYDDTLEYEDDDEYAMDEETRKIIWEASMRHQNNFNFDDISKDHNEKKSKQKKSNSNSNKNQKKKVGLSLEQFRNKIDEEAKAKQPKLFVSKRVEDKKKLNGVKEPVVKRQFNPRLPSYNSVKKLEETKKPVDFNNKNEFPSLLDLNLNK